VTVPGALGLPPSFQVQDLLTDDTYCWQQSGNYVRLAPGASHILHAR
jgi:hypothetical protein